MLSLLLFAAALQPVAASKSPTFIATGEIAMVIPNWASLTKTVPVDFDIYRITDRRTRLEVLGIYVGNNPDFDANKSTIGSIDGLKVQDIRSCSGGKCTRDILFTLPKGSSDMYIELWYSGLTEGKARESDEMIESVRYHKLSKHVFRRM